MKILKKRFQNSPEFKPYISSLVFPKYKNIFPGSELTLDFPLTLLTGKNGTNKSSILHALYGCPDGKSTGEYWFATHIDPIDERPAFFYRYAIPETGDIAEVLKTIIRKKTLSKRSYDPDYWEPSRPIKEYGMASLPKLQANKEMPIGRSTTRWNAIKKDVLYLDFRSEISAFDKAFYKDSKTISRPSHKQWMRTRSNLLKQVIAGKLVTYPYYGREKVFKNHTFTPGEIVLVDQIIGSQYKKIIYIEHNCYESDSFSVYLQKGENQNYSEAFAGSGETSVVRLVYALERASSKSLVLLDEPETSLHIDAQYNLQKYIIKRIKEKHLQVVISTHSPFFAKGLPDCAIKILEVVPELKGQVRIISSAPANKSSFHLGYRNHDANKINVYVEDMLAESLVNRVCNEHLTTSERDSLTIQHYTGGSSALIQMAGFEINKAQSNIAFLFDGDCKPATQIPNQSNIPPSEDGELETQITNLFVFCPKIPRDSSDNDDQKTSNFRKFLDYALERFQYLPFKNPETFLIENHNKLKVRSDKNDPKECFRNYTKEQLGSSGDINASDILTIQRQVLSGIPKDHSEFKTIAEILKRFIALAPQGV